MNQTSGITNIGSIQPRKQNLVPQPSEKPSISQKLKGIKNQNKLTMPTSWKRNMPDRREEIEKHLQFLKINNLTKDLLKATKIFSLLISAYFVKKHGYSTHHEQLFPLFL